MSRLSIADPIVQEPLAYPENALSPYISSKTLSVHYGKHHKAYVEKTNALIKGTSWEGSSLEEILVGTAHNEKAKSLFNNAAQAWNHSFYWKSMKPKGGGKPGRQLLDLIKSTFGNWEDFKKQFESAAVSHFGSGWVWLVQKNGQLAVTDTHDADNPLTHGQKPCLALDIWEHAYYLDYKNERPKYVEVFLEHLVDWDFVERNFYPS